MGVSVSDLSKEISEALQTYTNEVTLNMEKVKEEVAKETARGLKATSPKRRGKYAKGWTVKKIGTAQAVHNRDRYQLTHLLEKGHAKRGGGRVQAYPHIGPAEEKAIKEYIEKVEKVIKG